MPLPLLAMLGMSGLSALSGAFGNKRKQTQEQTSNTNQSFNKADSFDTTELPAYDEFQQNYKDQIYNKLLERLNQDPEMEGYSNQGQQTINRAGDSRQQALSHMLAQRGLQHSPISGYAAASADSARISDQSNFLNQIPLLKNQLQRDNLGDFSKFFSSLPTGSRRTGTQTSTGTTNGVTTGTGSGTETGGQGGFLGGLLGAGSTLAGLYGLGAFSKAPKSSMGNT